MTHAGIGLRTRRSPISQTLAAGDAISAALSGAVANGDVAGVVAGVATADGKTYHGAFGVADARLGAPIQQNALFFIASMTKAVTHVAIMQLIEQRRLSLDDRAADFLPALGKTQVLDGFDADGTPKLRAPRSIMTIRHLLAYTAGFAYPYWNPDIRRYAAWAEIPDIVSYREKSLDLPLVSDPGERWNYGINSEFLGKIVEQISGERLDRYVAAHIFEPLGMVNTYYVVPGDQRNRIAPIHSRQPNGALTPIELTLPEEPEFYPGGVGLFSTASDYLLFARMLLGHGTLHDRILLSGETVAMMGRTQLGAAAMAPMTSCDPFWSYDVDLFPGQETQWGLGFLLNTRPSPAGRGAFSLSWGGACNSFYWVDPSRGVTGVFMTALVPFCDPHALRALAAFESAVYGKSDVA